MAMAPAVCPGGRPRRRWMDPLPHGAVALAWAACVLVALPPPRRLGSAKCAAAAWRRRWRG